MSAPTVYPFQLSGHATKVASSSGKTRYRKQVAYSGTFWKNGRPIPLSKSDFEHWAATFSLMQNNGVEVPLPVEHSLNPKDRVGSVVGLETGLDDKGRESLFSIVEFGDEQTGKQLAASSNVSIYVEPSSTDGLGNVYNRPITHIAITDYPVIPGMGKFEVLAASRQQSLKKGSPKMEMLQLAQSLGLSITPNADDNAIAAAIQSHIAGLKSQIPAPPAKISASILKLGKDNRASKLDKLASDGKISADTRAKLAAHFVDKDEAISLSLQETPVDDGFDVVCEALGLNSAVVHTTPKTGEQPKPDAATGNPLLEDAKRRAEARK